MGRGATFHERPAFLYEGVHSCCCIDRKRSDVARTFSKKKPGICGWTKTTNTRKIPYLEQRGVHSADEEVVSGIHSIDHMKHR